MKKTLKRLLCLMLSVFMLTSIVAGLDFSVSARTSGDFQYEIISEKEKTCAITDYTGSAAELTIPSELDGYIVTSIGDFAFEDCTSLTSITIPDGVTSIGNHAFWDCTSLTSITIPDSVTSIGELAFRNCTSLTSVTIPDSVTSIGERAFESLDSLTNVTVSPGNKAYSSVGGVLFNKDKTELIQYPEGKQNKSYSIPDSVTNIGDFAFSGCESLTSITIPDSVTSIGVYVFFWCDSLTSIAIPDSVTSIEDYAFYCCKSLTSIAIPDSVTSIGNRAFYGCTSLTSVTIPNSVTSIEPWAFSSCDSLTSITIPDGVTKIWDGTFYYCESLTSIAIPDSVTSIGDYAFEDCDSLKDVYYAGSEADWDKISIGSYNTVLENATIHYNSKMPATFIGKQLRFENEVYLMEVNDTKEIKAYICDVYSDNGTLVYENQTPVDSSALNWSTNVGEENKVISFDQNGKVTALSEGKACLSAYVKEDINLYASCHIYVGKPNALAYKTVYDTKQYYAEGGFYSQTSSVSDCVELYCLFENKLADELQLLEDKIDVNDLSAIAPVTLTATVSGNDLSFDRNRYQNTYTATFGSISPGKAVDDILMLFPYNLSVPSSAKNYTVTVTLESESFDTVTEKFEFTVENLASKSANEHIGFASSNADYLVSKKNIYGQSMVSLKNDAEYKWSKYTSLDFENYYEVVFADVLAELMNTTQLDHVSLLPVVKEWVGNYNTILSTVSAIVEDDYTGYLDVSENAIDKLLKKSKYATDGMDVHDELRDYVLVKLKDKVSIDKINSAFAAVDKTKQYYSFFSLGVNITNDIVDFANSVSVLNSYKGMDDEFKAVVNTLYNQIPSSEKKLKDAVYHYVNVDSYLGYSQELFNEIRGMAGKITLDIFQSVYKKQFISSLCKCIGNITLKSGALLSSTSAFSAISTGLGAVSTGVTLGICISDILCNNSGKSAEMSKVVAMSEFSPYVIGTLNAYESKLYSDRNNTAVAEFEYAFAMHKATQSYIMEHTIRSLEIKRDSLIIKLFGRDDYDGLISDILAQQQSIENLKCHTDAGAETVVSKTKVIAVKCPVDVFVYDENGSEVVRIVNNVKEFISDGIEVFVENNEKYIALPMHQAYSVKIVAADSGSMEYVVTEYDAGVQRLQTVKKDNISLSPNQTFTGQIPKENDTKPIKYALQYDGQEIVPDDVVTVPITGIKLDQSNLPLCVGDTAKLTAVISPENVTNKNICWLSEDPSIATVDENGNVTAVSSGTVIIRAATEDWGFVAECTVTVVKAQVIGDVNGDGIIDAADAVMLQQYDAGITTLTDEQQKASDVTGDGMVDAADAARIQRYDAGLISSL